MSSPSPSINKKSPLLLTKIDPNKKYKLSERYASLIPHTIESIYYSDASRENVQKLMSVYGLHNINMVRNLAPIRAVKLLEALAEYNPLHVELINQVLKSAIVEDKDGSTR